MYISIDKVPYPAITTARPWFDRRIHRKQWPDHFLNHLAANYCYAWHVSQCHFCDTTGMLNIIRSSASRSRGGQYQSKTEPGWKIAPDTASTRIQPNFSTTSHPGLPHARVFIQSASSEMVDHLQGAVGWHSVFSALHHSPALTLSR